MNILITYLIFFFVGIFQDLLITYYYQVIAKEYAWRATIASSIVTLVNLIVLYRILTGLEEQALGIILIYALGNGIGTFIIIKKKSILNLLSRNK
ncbi:hypothetical protein COT95_00880 [Candidatus Falkowbacteria bacterium CG10_big_fil_rev_8_21_14_0_10_37_6]|uniref:Polysaccharide biosynthesis protein C-terminal domain-containing protein n=1 Tax=Candidatus Falkowbacteria bacterium CG10_big_fil_rev_8_21_14_0_10_37_6 TaxID=1974563 RepID=A0A2H0V7K0_9BACT|nr:MAG: hypothetical protein COT95_00880 [Candidatus Falkowbacteria bacterium CG10_big_fil_rev_8_21_14_0_10_37_6]